ncbi:F-box/kelch-repeat protein At3g23880-like [Papaver somniferum]|uniref:F-box/kelch-repeat protein At3g23880-like n=1 Tax=Papaver somniferum TaxID=3469 RepID=UPI000E6F5257|nr:F-box/kelch-repeat protein At3g23880-like [Papaver somniferum]
MIKNSFSVMLILDNIAYSLDNNTLSSSLFDGIQGHVKKIDCPLSPELTNVVGSCNGLFCMYSEVKEQCCLWNPCTTEVRFLPRSGFQGIRKKTRCSLGKGHGFGYDFKSDDYKYVRIFCNGSRSSPDSQSQVQIYSFRTNMWKEMYVPYILTNVDRNENAPNGVSCNGALHWFARKNSSPKVLLVFDMIGVGVREIPEPENMDVKNLGNSKYVDVLDGKSLHSSQWWFSRFPCMGNEGLRNERIVDNDAQH